MPRSGSLECPLEQSSDVGGGQRPQLVELRAREQRRVDLEVGVLGRRADQRQQALLDRRQQRVLLGLVEAVDLVEEEDRRLVADAAALLGPLDHRPHLGPAGVDGRLLLERAARRGGDDPRQGRLARPRRPVEDHRMGLARLDRSAQRRARAEQVLLADELVERPGAHPHRQRRLGDRHAGAAGGLLVAIVEEPLHGRKYHASRVRAEAMVGAQVT